MDIDPRSSSSERDDWLSGAAGPLEPTQSETSKQSESEISQPPRRILVVDDHKDTRESMATLLQEFGYLVQVAQDGRVALELALDFEPQVILLDLRLPDMSGFKLAEKVRADPALWDTLLISITGWDEDNTPVHSKRAGCDYHLVKPLDVFLLESLLSRSPPRTSDEA